MKSLSENPFLKKLIRTLDKGDELFTQGSSGNSVFLVLDGELDLIRRNQNNIFSLGKVGPGQFIGEKALLGGNPFSR
ncbi:MAG: cyclic nucleotide-binding domain-containing protein, partial [Pseudomonadota bacterium]